MADWLFLIPLLPLAAFAINILFGRGYIRDKAHWIAAPAVFGSWLLSIFVFFDIRGNDEGAKAISQHLFTWIPSGAFDVQINLFADQLTAVMLLVVTTVGFLVHVYSIGYMHGDGGYYRFFAYLPLFVFSMLMLVLADNFLLLFVFWEAVGLCSFFLIGFWFKRRSAVNAAKKAFIVNRIGDLGFGLGIMLTFWTFHTVNFHGPEGVFARVGEVSETKLTWIALLLFIGACGKSAQFPLHVWLPDAMEGPTPVSALIHAATMVTAGIYMIARVHSIVLGSDTAMVIIAIVGAFTAFMAASIAITQNDIKRVVAYSTVSQLGYMAFALGSGAWVAAIFHLMTHAFFKGLLFLGCGSVIHGMHEEQDIQKMGNLRRYMPITFWTFLIASLANAGVIPFAGFWSKDEIIVGSWVSGTWGGKVYAIVGLAAAFMTALYMFRLVFLVFFTRERFDTAHVHPHESPPAMSVPLILLAIPAALIGFIGFPPEDGPFQHFLEPVFESGAEPAAEAARTLQPGAEQASLYTIVREDDPATTVEEGASAGEAHAAEEHHVSTRTTVTFGIISTLVALSGIFVAYLAYIREAIDYRAVAARFNGLYRFLLEKWRFDEAYNKWLVRPIMATVTLPAALFRPEVSAATATLRANELAANQVPPEEVPYDLPAGAQPPQIPTTGLAMILWLIVDRGIIDATVNGVASGISAISQRLRHVQTGLVSNYALAIALGMVLIVGIYLTGFSSLFR